MLEKPTPLDDLERSDDAGSSSSSPSRSSISSVEWSKETYPLSREEARRSSWTAFSSLAVPSVTSRLCRVAFALLPSYVQSWLKEDDRTPQKLYPTSAMDGLRGFAALFVFFFHYLMAHNDIANCGYGQGDNRWAIQLPFIRLFHSGIAMVDVFFVISGYVLSYKPLRQIHSKSWDQMMHTLTSSIFRRGMRLFLPTIAATFITMLTVRMGLWEHARAVLLDPDIIRGDREAHPAILPTFSLQLWDWYVDVCNMMNLWHWGIFYPNHDRHLWTIPIEYKSSMILFLTIIGLAKARTFVRLTLLALLICYCVSWDRWEVVLFLSGMFLAETDLLVSERRQPINSNAFENRDMDPECPTDKKTLASSVWLVIFTLALYLLSTPNKLPEETPGYMWIMSLVPSTYSGQFRFPQTVGALMAVLSINNSKLLQRPFNTGLAQYLGKISYAFYIVHGPMLHTLSFSVLPIMWRITGRETERQYNWGLVLGVFIVLPSVFWVADLFWRFVDAPLVRFSKWVEWILCLRPAPASIHPTVPALPQIVLQER